MVVVVVLGGGDWGGELARSVVMTPAGACRLGGLGGVPAGVETLCVAYLGSTIWESKHYIVTP